MNQTEAMMIHVELVKSLFSQFVGIEYARALDDFKREAEQMNFDIPPVDEDDPRHIDPGSMKFEVDLVRAFDTAQQAANIYCVSTGFAEEIPPDDRKPGGPILRAKVPPQFRGAIPASRAVGGDRSAASSPDEAMAMVEKILQVTGEELGIDPDKGRRMMARVRIKVADALREHGIPVPTYKMPPEQTGRKPFGWESRYGEHDEKDDDDES